MYLRKSADREEQVNSFCQGMWYWETGGEFCQGDCMIKNVYFQFLWLRNAFSSNLNTRNLCLRENWGWEKTMLKLCLAIVTLTSVNLISYKGVFNSLNSSLRNIEINTVADVSCSNHPERFFELKTKICHFACLHFCTIHKGFHWFFFILKVISPCWICKVESFLFAKNEVSLSKQPK